MYIRRAADEALLPKSVLIIEPSKPSRDKASAMVHRVGLEPRAAADVFEAHALVDGTRAVVAAHPMAADIYPRLRASGIPLIAVFSAKQPRPSETAHAIGADAFVTRPYRGDMLTAAIYAATGARMLRTRAVRAEAALADLRGGVQLSREKNSVLHIDLFKTLLPLEIRRARRHGYPIAICVVCIDPLPRAQHVSPALVAACEPLVRRAVRDVDLAVRYGNGRFLVFLPHTDGPGAEAVGRRIIQQIRSCRVKAAGTTLHVTASLGIAAPRKGRAPSFARLIRDAHAAVKAAQLKGGDRAILR